MRKQSNMHLQSLTKTLSANNMSIRKFYKYLKEANCRGYKAHFKYIGSIGSAFVWSETKEGQEFWAKIEQQQRNKLKRMEQNGK